MFGITLPFSTYLLATSMLAFLSNPFTVAVTIGGAGTLLVRKANQLIQNRLYAVLVTLAFVCQAAGPGPSVTEVSDALNQRYAEFLKSSGQHRKSLKAAFPAFVDPQEKSFVSRAVDGVRSRVGRSPCWQSSARLCLPARFTTSGCLKASW